MARPIPYEHSLTEWTSAGTSRRVLRGLIIGLMLSILISAAVWILSTNVDSKIFGDTSTLAGICRYLYESKVGSGIRESVWVFPMIEGTHLLGIALSVGMLCWFDLRLLGLVLRDEPVSKVWKQVMPVAFAAFHSVHFWIKMLLLLLAGVNALRFETTAHRNMAEWDLAPVPPLNARMTGAISLILWTAIIITGRTMAYNF